MFERFTERARRVVVLAQDEARELSHNYIGTEHLLLGLIRDREGVAGRALGELGVALAAARQQVVDIVGEGQQEPSGHIPFTPRAKKVLELSLREALQLGHDYIGTEHILLGVLREGEGVAIQVLQNLDAEPAQIRQRVMRKVEVGAEDPASAGAHAFRMGTRLGVRPGQLDQLTRRLDEILARLAAIERHLGIPPPAGETGAGEPAEPPGAGEPGTGPPGAGEAGAGEAGAGEAGAWEAGAEPPGAVAQE